MKEMDTQFLTPTKWWLNVIEKPTEIHKNTLKEEILEEITEKFMEKILDKVN
jgi:hypothetical protein